MSSIQGCGDAIARDEGDPGGPAPSGAELGAAPLWRRPARAGEERIRKSKAGRGGTKQVGTARIRMVGVDSHSISLRLTVGERSQAYARMAHDRDGGSHYREENHLKKWFPDLLFSTFPSIGGYAPTPTSGKALFSPPPVSSRCSRVCCACARSCSQRESSPLSTLPFGTALVPHLALSALWRDALRLRASLTRGVAAYHPSCLGSGVLP